MTKEQTAYDFIVTGAGAAGRSFVYHLLQSPLRDSKILLLDREQKTADDRTWSFWEETPGPFQEIVHHQWPQLQFYADGFARDLDIAPFTYKMILAADYYRFTDQAFAAFPNVHQLTTNINAIQNTPTGVRVATDAGTFTAPWCINSTGHPAIDKSQVNYLDQHFRGWFIQTEQPVFDPQRAVMMDFRTPQEGEFRFLYVLPTSPTEALVEVAIFSNAHLSAAGYDTIISSYLRDHWPHLGPFSVVRTEAGNIPMTDYPFPPHDGQIINVGLVGGDTRAATGYTFIYIHQRMQRIVAALLENGDPRLRTTLQQKRHRLYDSTMLRVLAKDLYPGDQLFRRLFQKNPPARLLRFLNGDSTLTEELPIMASTPVGVFMRAFLQSL
ncbi:MAG: lycopene cyclase [Bacteroidetes bacterium]|nr:MAG: lycopene cyclase [Bacteroidota bacterium]PTM11623.1 MAG: lycopene cyclase [Bacteroidota bacterium]